MCVYSFIILVSCLFILGVLGPWEFSGGPGHILSVRMCDSAVWSAGPVQFYSGTLLEWMAGLHGFSFLSCSVVAGTVRLN